MSYRDFTVGKLKQQFDLKFIEQAKPIIEPLSLTPSLYIQETIERNFRIAQAVSTEKFALS